MYSVQPKFYSVRGAGAPTHKKPHGISSDLCMDQSHIAIAPLDHLTPLKLTNLGVLIDQFMLLVRKNNHGILKGKNKALILNFKKGINVELGKKNRLSTRGWYGI